MKIYPYLATGPYVTLRLVSKDFPMLRYLEQFSDYDEEIDECIYYFKILPILEDVLIVYIDYMDQYILTVESETPGRWVSYQSSDSLFECLHSKGKYPTIDAYNLNAELFVYYKENFELILDFIKKEAQTAE